jgi:hypothetical protein
MKPDPIDAIEDELWAWITDAPDGRSIVGALTAFGHTPLVFARKSSALKFEDMARNHGRSLSQPVRLVHFRIGPDRADVLKIIQTLVGSLEPLRRSITPQATDRLIKGAVDALMGSEG